ncbi:MAG: GNAT family N-acetyltransferase [Thermomicrobiales bacterium]
MTQDSLGELIYIDPTSRLELRQLSENEEAAAASVLAPAVLAGTEEAAALRITELKAESKTVLYGGFVDQNMIAAYVLCRDGMANEISLIAVAENHRKRGIGRLLLQDALRRSGKRPLVAETDEDGLDFYKACGFKLVGRRKQPSGAFRYRIGWHAPGLRFKGGSTNALEGQPVRMQEEQD